MIIKKGVSVQRKNKGQAGGSAATVIGIMALLFVFYILFLPPEERRDLLYGTDENGTYIGSGSRDYNRTLLLANIGRLDYIPEDSYDHTMPNVQLARIQQAQVLATFSPFVLRRNWLENKRKDLTFNILDPDKTDNVLLAFETPVRKGILTVWLNDQVVYEATIDSQTPPAIPLRKAQLGSTNKLVFELSGVGLAFWRTNEMQFTNVQVIGDVADEKFQRSTSTFTLLEEEARNMEKATLFFYPVCDPNEIGLLEATVNDNTVNSGRPDCDSINKIELDTRQLRAGANTLGLRSTQGTIRIDQLRVKTELEETKSFIDYFELNSTDLIRVREGRSRVHLNIKFVDDKEDKQGTISINGILSTFDQRNATYSKNVSAYVQEGNNYVELRPETVLNIVKLEVRLE